MSLPPADSSEDVNDFLQRIKELGDRRDQEDEERNKKLEEEILQGRKERQARRAGTSNSLILQIVDCDGLSWFNISDDKCELRARQVNISNKIFSYDYTYCVQSLFSTHEQFISRTDPSS
jgi:hypothetical protein